MDDPDGRGGDGDCSSNPKTPRLLDDEEGRGNEGEVVARVDGIGAFGSTGVGMGRRGGNGHADFERGR